MWTISSSAGVAGGEALRRSHEVPGEEALEPAVEVDLRAGAEKAVGLAGVGEVLERLAEPAQRRDELLRLLGAHALVALAVRDEQRRPDVLQAVDGGAGAVGLTRGRGRAHHP